MKNYFEWHRSCIKRSNYTEKLMMLQKARLLLFFMVAIHLMEFSTSSVLAQKPENLSILRLGTYRKLAPLNPFEVSDSFSTPLMELVFNRLVRYDAQGQFEPDLAQKWKISDDGKTYTFFLRQGVRFHDGVECTASDVMHSLELAGDPAVSPSLAGPLKIIQEMKEVSKFSLEIKLKESFAPFLLVLWRVYIIPQHRLAQFPQDLPEFLKNPIGTGPFIFSRQDSSGIQLKANPGYFQGGSSLGGVDIQVYSHKDQMWSAFLRDELDLFFYLEWKNYLEIKHHPGSRVFHALSSAGYALIFNLNQPTLQDSKVREAIACGINRQELINVLENGEGVLMEGPFHPNSWSSTPGTSFASYDPSRTNTLLREAGFKETRNVKEKNGKKFVLNLLVDPKNEQLVRISKLIRQQLQEVGIGVEFHFFYSDEEFKKNIYQHNEMHIYLMSLNTGPEPDTVSRYWGTHEKVNVSGYSSAEVDLLFKAARSSPTQQARAVIYQKIQKLIAADKPAVFLYYPYVFHAASTHCLNVEELFGSFILFHKLKDVHKEAV